MKGNYHQSFSKVLYVPGLGRSPRGGNSTHFSILTRKIPWTEELEGLQSLVGNNQWGHKTVGQDLVTTEQTLYGTGNFTQYPAVTYISEKNLKKNEQTFMYNLTTLLDI